MKGEMSVAGMEMAPRRGNNGKVSDSCQGCLQIFGSFVQRPSISNPFIVEMGGSACRWLLSGVEMPNPAV